MPGKQQKKTGKGRLDKYYHLAKEQGYRSRAAFKLIQLNKKYDFLSKANVVLDLCAAPGGWLQVASKTMPMNSLIIGVDLDPIRPIPNVKTFVGDITTQKCRVTLRELLGGSKASKGKVDVVLHDGAPNLGGAWGRDAYNQAELVLHSVKLASEFLMEDGCFISKVFRSAEYTALMWVFQQLFDKVEATKPLSSRNTSAEIFVVCRGYKAPDKIDPRMLDPKHVFEQVESTKAKPDVFHKKIGKKVRNRSGYDETMGMGLHRRYSVADFVEANGEDAVRALSDFQQLEFDDRSRVYRDHEATTDEIVACCADLQVLGKADFKGLLKWRKAMQEVHRAMVAAIKKAQGLDDDDAKEGADGDAAEEEDDLDSDAREEQELDKKLAAAIKKQAGILKRKKKKEARTKAKNRMRLALGMNESSVDVDAAGQGGDDEELFKVTVARTAEDVDLIQNVPLDDDRIDDLNRAALEEAEEAAEGEAKNLFPHGRPPSMRPDVEAEDSDASDGDYDRDMADAFERDHVLRREKKKLRDAVLEERYSTMRGVVGKKRREELQLEKAMSEKVLRIDPDQEKYKRSVRDANSDDDSDAEQSSGDEVGNGGDDDDDDGDMETTVVPRVDPAELFDRRSKRAALVDDLGNRKAEQDVAVDKWFNNPIFKIDAQSGDISLDAPKSERQKRKDRNRRQRERDEARAALREQRDREKNGLAKAGDGHSKSGAGIGDGQLGDEEGDHLAGLIGGNGQKIRVKVVKQDKASLVMNPALSRVAEEDRGVGSSDAAADAAGISSRKKRKAGDVSGKASNLEDIASTAKLTKTAIDHDNLSALRAVDKKMKNALRLAGYDKVFRQLSKIDQAALTLDTSNEVEVEEEDEGEDSIGSGDEATDGAPEKRKRGKNKKRQRSLPAARAELAAKTNPAVDPAKVTRASKQALPPAILRVSELEKTNDEMVLEDLAEVKVGSDEHAEILAMGKLMMQAGKSGTAALLDASYNKYCHNDVDLPTWFIEDENKHFRPQMPITKAMVNEIKQQFADLASKPIKKVAEARARKRARAQQKLRKAKARVAQVMAAPEISDSSKLKEIRKIYKRAEVRDAPKKYVVSGSNTNTGNRKGGFGTRFVDSRLKNDKRMASKAAKTGGKRSKRAKNVHTRNRRKRK